MITGGRGGIGRACAELFAGEGAQVLALDIRPDAPEYDVAGIDYRVHDVSDPEAWDAIARDAVPSGGVDIVVNAAGIGLPGSIHDVEMDAWNRVIAVNQTGVMLGTRFGVRSMLAHGRGGSIVNISSIWGSTATEGFAGYHASKGAVTMITRNAAVSYAASGIRANAIHPGLIRTPMSDGNSDEFNGAVIAATPLGRIGEAVDVAFGALYLASAESRYVTGASLFIDGGFNAV